MKPNITKTKIFDKYDPESGSLNTYSVTCGKCGELFGLMSEDSERDFRYYKEHYRFCNKCGTSVHWN